MHLLSKKSVTLWLLPVALLLTACPSVLAQGRNEFQPAMQSALQSLKQAEDSLRRATSDKGGHRVRALQIIEQAEREVQAGIVYDDRHRS